MRQPFDPAPGFHVIPIEKIVLPLRSRDELPPILAGLQWIWTHPELKGKIFELLEAKVLAGKKATGRFGMDLWQILVLGVVRLGLDANWDRLEDMANYHVLLRQMLGVDQTPWGQESKVFNHQTLRDNVALVDEPLLKEINALVAASGRDVFKKKKTGRVSRWRSTWTPTCWKPMCIFRRISICCGTPGASAWIWWKSIGIK